MNAIQTDCIFLLIKMVDCVACGEEVLYDEYEDPIGEIEGALCHRCFLVRAQQKGSLSISWSIKNESAKSKSINQLGEMLSYLTFADVSALEQLKERVIFIADHNPRITEEEKKRMLSVLNAAISR